MSSCTTVSNTIQYRTVLIIFPLIIIAQMFFAGREVNWNVLLWWKSVRNIELCLHWPLVATVFCRCWNLTFSWSSHVLCLEELSAILTSRPPFCSSRKLLDQIQCKKTGPTDTENRKGAKYFAKYYSSFYRTDTPTVANNSKAIIDWKLYGVSNDNSATNTTSSLQILTNK